LLTEISGTGGDFPAGGTSWEKWENKIEGNRRRYRRNHAKLRRQRWKVVRIWEHQIERDLSACILRIAEELKKTEQHPPA
jgi:G:T-mismatch repair DNA endonuclease (very short patch repair protein)